MKSRAFIFFAFITPLILWALSPLASHAAVTLIYFTGHGMQGFIHLEWATATELDNAGFYIMRSDSQLGSYTRISPFIPTGPDSIAGYTYSYNDLNVVNEIGYWYQLEMVDTQGESTYDGPIQVIAGVYATDEPTTTATATATNPVQAGSTATATRTSTPARTRTPTRTSISSFSQPSSTFSQFATATLSGLPTDQAGGTQALLSTQSSLSLTETLTATATLVPLPEITMQFPTEFVELAAANQQADLGGQTSGLEDTRRVWFTLERLIFLGFILLVWVLLAGWFYLSYRRTEE